MSEPSSHEEVDRKVQITSDTAEKLLRHNARTSRANTGVVRLAAGFVVIAVFYVCVVLTLFATTSIHKQNTAHSQTIGQGKQVARLEGQIINLLNGHTAELKADNTTLVEVKAILRQVLTVTSPKSRAAAAKAGETELRFVVKCINNYSLRSHENNHHQLVSPLVRGCPFVALEHDAPLANPGPPKDPNR